MKNRVFCCTLLWVFVLMGCSSDDNEPNDNQHEDYYFHFKEDGDQVSYEYQPKTQVNLTGSILFDSGTNTNIASIAGMENIFESGTKNRLTIFLSDSDAIATSVRYTNVEDEGDVNPNSVFLMGYYDGQGNLYSAALNPGPKALYELATISFTEITNTQISGTFSGTLLWYDVSGGTTELLDSVVISEGMFSVPRY